MPIPVRLTAATPEHEALSGDSLGMCLQRRRRELGLRRIDAAAQLGVDEKTLMWWELDAREPIVSAYPRLIEFLGYEPWSEPCSLAEALLAERRRRGMEIRQIAALTGVDEGTWRRWERKEWKPTRLTVPALNQLLRRPVALDFPKDIR